MLVKDRNTTVDDDDHVGKHLVLLNGFGTSNDHSITFAYLQSDKLSPKMFQD